MNIFYTNHDPKICAIEHMNKHVIKQIIEYAQLLSTAHRVLDGKEVIQKRCVNGSFPARFRNVKVWELTDFREKVLYSATHINHPSAVWVRQSIYNYMWLSNLLVELCKEYTYRYGKIHKAEREGLIQMLWEVVPDNIPHTEFTEPTPAMPKDVIISNDSLSSYRNYYNLNKQHLANWSGKINSRKIPTWYQIRSDNAIV